jgi:hypothetical protein
LLPEGDEGGVVGGGHRAALVSEPIEQA